MKRILLQKAEVQGWVLGRYIDSVFYEKINDNNYYLYIGLVSGRKYREKYSTEKQCQKRMDYIYSYVE